MRVSAKEMCCYLCLEYAGFCKGNKHSAHIFSMPSDSLREKLLKQTTGNCYRQQGMLPAQQSAPTAQHAPAASTELDVANAAIAATIFNALIFIHTSK